MMKAKIDEEIVVLAQKYANDVAEKKKTKEQKKAEQSGEVVASQGDGTQIRAYINNVQIKVDINEVVQLEGDQPTTKSKGRMLEQNFKVTEETSFIKMRDEACEFWGLKDKEEFTLVLPNNHEIMQINGDATHPAHTIAKYFEIARAKKAILHLVRPDKYRKEVLIQEKTFIKIQGVQATSRFEGKERLSYEELKALRDKKDMKIFFKKYPDLEEIQIKDMKQFGVGRNRSNQPSKIENPDMSFCNFILSLSMLSLSVWTFFSHRDFNNEYFNRQLVYNKLMMNPHDGFRNFDSISTVEHLYQFLDTTIAEQIFESEESRWKLGNPDYMDYISPYMFQKSLVPVGKMRIRQQRRATIECSTEKERIKKLRSNNDTQIRCLNQALSSKKQRNDKI